MRMSIRLAKANCRDWKLLPFEGMILEAYSRKWKYERRKALFMGVRKERLSKGRKKEKMLLLLCYDIVIWNMMGFGSFDLSGRKRFYQETYIGGRFHCFDKTKFC